MPWMSLTVMGMLSLQAATLNVQNFGAAGNGTTDDTAAIQKAVNTSAPGDVILFSGGTYRLSYPIKVLSNRTYQGQSGAKLLGPGGWYTFATPWDATSNIAITGLIFDGAPLAIQGDTVAASNVQITNCTFENITSTGANWTSHQGIYIGGGLTNSSIANNTFRNILPGGLATSAQLSWGAGIFGNNVKNTTISNNLCDTVQQCMYFTSNTSSTFPGFVISNNTGINVHRMGIEMQMASCTVQITGNTFSNFLNPFWDTFGISFTSPTCAGDIENNTLIATGNTQGYGIEAWGTNTLVANNSIQGNWTLGVAIGLSTDLSVTNNYLCGSTGAMTIAKENYPIAGSVVQGNTTSLVCSPQSTAPSPPTVSLTQPAPNTIVSGSIALAANASSSVGISLVQFQLDGTQFLAQDPSAPFLASFNTATVANGTHLLTAIATDSTGLQTTSAPVSISVQNAVSPPPVTSLPLPPGMSLWLDASANVTAANGTVSAWGDKSGNNLVATQPVAGLQPTLVAGAAAGSPIVRFNGRSAWMSVPLPINGLTGMEVFLVSSNTLNSISGYGINAALVWNETAPWGTTFVGPFQTDVNYRFGTTQANNSPWYFRPRSIGSAYSLTEIQHNGTTDSLYVNGTLVQTQGGEWAAINGTVPVLTLGQFAGGHSYFAGDIAEIIVYPRALSATQQQEVQTYLQAKYSLY